MRTVHLILRGFVFLALAAVASPIPAVASDLPTLDTYSYCVREIQERRFGHPKSYDEFEWQVSSCYRGEGDAKRDARWRLRMIPKEDRQTCIDEGIAENSYRAIGDCLDRFTGPLRG